MVNAANVGVLKRFLTKDIYGIMTPDLRGETTAGHRIQAEII